MYKGFLEFVGTEHPDPDSLLGNDYVFNELVKLADNYCEKQLLIQRVVLQSEQLCLNCNKETATNGVGEIKRVCTKCWNSMFKDN